jgi:hypothetical protein
MGLDIYAYSKIVEETEVSANQKRLEELGLTERGEEIYRIETFDANSYKGLSPGTYFTTDQSESHDFRAGSYSGYNQWRRVLSQTMLGVSPDQVWTNPDEWKDKPFFGLINHSDCDGAIGGPVAKSLYRDFVEWRSKAAQYQGEPEREDRDWFLEVYDDFLKAFELAADDGILIFS